MNIRSRKDLTPLVANVSPNGLFGRGTVFILLFLADIEEFLEMSGLILFLDVLLNHLRSLPSGQGAKLELHLEP